MTEPEQVQLLEEGRSLAFTARASEDRQERETALMLLDDLLSRLVEDMTHVEV